VHKAGVIVGVIFAALLLPCVGGLAVIGAVSDDSASKEPTEVQRLADARPPATPSVTPSASSAPVVVKRTVTETEPIKFKKRQVKDGDLPKGEKEKRTPGVNGERTKTYEVTVVNGRETARKLLTSKVTRKPVTEVLAIGTYVEPEEETGGDCAPGYDPCVPVASDVDCAGGSGNGPAYVDGPIRVTGSDPYDLDRDGDGTACDS
jgi:resuscitation-promoting factor RpfB